LCHPCKTKQTLEWGTPNSQFYTLGLTLPFLSAADWCGPADLWYNECVIPLGYTSGEILGLKLPGAERP
ncbi:MAG: hypothetical protein JXA57_17505, partial [Armatimonadetes bacterium]|nr:hypothetical protein [Armatimonadota bacterium]